MHTFQKRLDLTKGTKGHLRERIAGLLQISSDRIGVPELFAEQFFKLAGSRWYRKRSYRDILIDLLELTDYMAEWRSKSDKPPPVSSSVDIENIEDYISIACYTAYTARCDNEKEDSTPATDGLTNAIIQELRQRAERRIDTTLEAELSTEAVWPEGLTKVGLRQPQKGLSKNKQRILHVIMIFINIRMLNETIGNITTRSF